MKQRKHSRARLAANPLYAILFGSAMLLPAAVHAASTDTVLDTVTVTGEKMKRSLAKTTTAVSVLQAEKVDTGEVSSVNEVAAQVPNMTLNAVGGVNIRGVEGAGPGVGFYSFVGGGRPRISTSLDGVADVWTGQQYLDSDVWDVKQVEVLRGPQSTTQGRNALGGAVLVQTNDPSFQQEGALRLGWEDTDGRANVAGMLSGALVEDELAYRLTANAVKGHGFINYTGVAGQDPSALQRSNVRGKLLWKPKSIPQLQARLTVAHRDYLGEYLNLISAPDLGAYTYRASAAANARIQDSQNTTTTLDTEYDFQNGVTGHLQYSYSDNHIGFEQYPSRMSLALDDQNHTLEGRLVFQRPQSALGGVLGLYAYQRDQDLFANQGSSPLFRGTDKVTTLAAYADGELALNDSWSLLAGLRAERETQNRDVVYNRMPIKGDIGKTLLLPKIGISHQWSPVTQMSFTVRQGYNPGGVSVDENNVVFEYGSEKVNAYEYALKTRQGGVLLGANLFYNDYTDYQMSYASRLRNVPQAHTTGLELSAAASIIGGLELNAGLGLLRSKVDKAPAGAGGIAGKEMTYAPDITATLGVKKQWGSWSAAANLQHVGEYYTDTANTSTTMGGDYNLLNLNLAYAMNDETTVRAYVKNALNEDIMLGKRTTGFYVGAPRTLGMNVDYRF
ncbi:TonB-dependent receptor [Vogesella sp. DC21W]|uniref:TonB-dependent receptor n=1 Tax=Vogesella aquatica TaxID=2984206 RepID=A0ABT5IST5_9NEIS|nr:TonB-dependent receptor [Vogesella aquatica]MDC7715628.1 TonB-dependent receptor [Vogesella aquatica]